MSLSLLSWHIYCDGKVVFFITYFRVQGLQEMPSPLPPRTLLIEPRDWTTRLHMHRKRIMLFPRHKLPGILFNLLLYGYLGQTAWLTFIQSPKIHTHSGSGISGVLPIRQWISLDTKLKIQNFISEPSWPRNTCKKYSSVKSNILFYRVTLIYWYYIPLATYS